jgi:hypothetical protein
MSQTAYSSRKIHHCHLEEGIPALPNGEAAYYLFGTIIFQWGIFG